MNAKDLSSGVVKCSVISCSHFYNVDSSTSTMNFFNFPTDYNIAKTWKEKCGVASDYVTINAKVCSDHFKSTDFVDSACNQLKSDAIPRENLGWMIGMPEIKISEVLKLQDIKDVELLLNRKELLTAEQKSIIEKIKLYDRKICNINYEIEKLHKAIAKLPIKKQSNKNCRSGESANFICKVFSQAQINMLMGKKVIWSHDDMARAFTLRHIGNRECYLYLKNTLNMPLPSLSSVQRWAASNKP